MKAKELVSHKIAHKTLGFDARIDKIEEDIKKMPKAVTGHGGGGTSIIVSATEPTKKRIGTGWLDTSE